MRDVVRDLLHALHQILDLVEHLVEFGGYFIKFIIARGYRQAL